MLTDSLAPDVGVLVADPVYPAACDELADKAPRSAAPRDLPAVEPGQLWLVELRPGAPLVPAVRRLIEAANVVVYDRDLADAVAAALPLGAYAEPAPRTADAVERCVRFAQDGWSVVRLTAGSQAPRRAVETVSARLRESGAAAGLGVRVFAVCGERTREAGLRELDAAPETQRGQRLIVAFAAVAVGGVAPAGAVVGNGLAG